MSHALALARRGEGHTRPNPPVGAVIVRDGELLAEGWHRRCGGPHAEAAAIAAAQRRGVDLRGADLYVTLEPCSRAGRVGACTDAIAAVGIGRVFYAVGDPNPVNRGRAGRVLARAGVECRRFAFAGATSLAADCRRLIAPFARHVATGLPYVTVKIAMSLDGRICDNRGDARWVSSDASRRRTGALRERVDAILVGAETVRRDNPSLLSHGRRNDDLIRAVVSRSGRLPSGARIFTDGAPNRTLVFPDPRTAIETLGRMGAMHVLCEGGLRTATALAREGLVDEWLTVLAPKVIGERLIGECVVFPGCDAFVNFCR